MNARELIENTFIAPFRQKNRRFVGVELEFPLLATGSLPVTEQMGLSLLDFIQTQGFKVAETDIHGHGVFLLNDDNDCLSFDNAYQNFEFSMAKGEDLTELAARFYRLYDMVQGYLLPKSFTLSGLGTNPMQPQLKAHPVDYPIYMTLRRFLGGFSGGAYHTIADFPAWLSSVQTHLDISAERLPQALTLFAALDFVRGLFFSNALPFAGLAGHENTLCLRDYLWEKSGFGSLADNTGAVCGSFDTTDDIVNMLLQKSMFLSVDDMGYHIMPPVSLAEYFDTVGTERDIEGYLSFKNVEVTRRGTLEVRSDCAQPVGEAFVPPAFNLGILQNVEAAAERLQAFMELLPLEVAAVPNRNALLRSCVINGAVLPVSADAVRALLSDMVNLARVGLVQRGKGEEKLLQPLLVRAEACCCPALVTRRRLQNGEPWAAVIRDYANPHYQLGDDIQ